MRKKKNEHDPPRVWIVRERVELDKEIIQIIAKAKNDPSLKPYVNWMLEGKVVEVDNSISDDKENLVLKQNLSQLYLQLITLYDKQMCSDVIVYLLGLGLNKKTMELYLILLQELEQLMKNPREDSFLRTKSKIARHVMDSEKTKYISYKDIKAVIKLIDELIKLKLLIQVDSIKGVENTFYFKKSLYAPCMILDYKIGARLVQLPWDILRYAISISNYLYNDSFSSYNEELIENNKKVIGKMSTSGIREEIKVSLKRLNLDPHDFLEIFSEEQYNGHMNFYKDLVRIKEEGRPTRKYRYTPGYHKYGKGLKTNKTSKKNNKQ